MTWTLNLDTFDLVDPEGRTDFSRDEFARQDWPPCPACGRTILADRMPTPATVDGPERYRSAVLQASAEERSFGLPAATLIQQSIAARPGRHDLPARSVSLADNLAARCGV